MNIQNSATEVSSPPDNSLAATHPSTRSMPRRNRDLAPVTLAVIAFVAALYLAHAFFVPLLIGILASYTLSPLVDWLKVCYLPRPVGAAVVIAALIGALGWLMISFGNDAAEMIESLPEATRKLRQDLSETRSIPTTLQNIQEAAKQIEGAAADAGTESAGQSSAPVPGSSWLRDYALEQSALLLAVIAQAPIVFLLTYFLLSSGSDFRRKLIQFVGPSVTRKKEAINMLDEIDVQIQRYMFSMLVSSALVGIGTWLAFKALGMEQAGVWGIVSFILQFIPYLGPALTATAGGIANFVQFGSLPYALSAAGISLLMAVGIGFVFTTWLQSRFANVSATVLFIALLFFAWLWGVWGLLLGAPLVAIAKVICDRVESLKPIGELLGR